MSRQADLLEAYHNILYVINNAPLNSYPKFGKNDVKKFRPIRLKRLLATLSDTGWHPFRPTNTRMSNWFWGIPGRAKRWWKKTFSRAIPERY